MKIKSSCSDRQSSLLCFSKFYFIWEIDQNSAIHYHTGIKLDSPTQSFMLYWCMLTIRCRK